MSGIAQSSPGRLYINGEWRPAAGGRQIDVINPATEETIASVAAATGEELDAAVAAAGAARSGPSGTMSARDRGRLLWKMGERILERVDEFARLETLHNGKPIFESRHIEIPASAECLQ